MTVLEAAEAANPEDNLAPKTADIYAKTMKIFFNLEQLYRVRGAYKYSCKRKES